MDENEAKCPVEQCPIFELLLQGPLANCEIAPVRNPSHVYVTAEEHDAYRSGQLAAPEVASPALKRKASTELLGTAQKHVKVDGSSVAAVSPSRKRKAETELSEAGPPKQLKTHELEVLEFSAEEQELIDREVSPLKKLNGTPRENRIWMRSRDHKYIVDEDPTRHWTSATTLTKPYFPQFDPVANANRMTDRTTAEFVAKYPKYAFLVKSPEQTPAETNQALRAYWEANGKQKRELGTSMHRWIEIFGNYQVGGQAYLDTLRPRERIWFLHYLANPVHELRQFLKFYKEEIVDQGFEFEMSEWQLFDEDAMVAGCVDAVFKHKVTGRRLLVDWKRSVVSDVAFAGARGLHHCSSLDASDVGKYTLQLNIYKFMLRKCNGIEIADGDMLIRGFTPDLAEDTYRKVSVLDRQDIVAKIWEEREAMLVVAGAA